MFSSFNAENYNRKQSQFQGIVKNINDYSNVNDNQQNKDKKITGSKGGSCINDL